MCAFVFFLKIFSYKQIVEPRVNILKFIEFVKMWIVITIFLEI